MIGCFDELLASTSTRVEVSYNIYKEKVIKRMKLNGCKSIICNDQNELK